MHANWAFLWIARTVNLPMKKSKRSLILTTLGAEKKGAGNYADVSGFCKSVTLDEIRKQDHILTPGRYVGAEEQEDDGEPFEEKMERLSKQWRKQRAEAARLDEAIEANLKELGYGE